MQGDRPLQYCNHYLRNKLLSKSIKIMKKNLLYFLCSWLLAFLGVNSVMAADDTNGSTTEPFTVYGVASSSLNGVAASFDINALTPDSKLAVTKTFEMKDVAEFSCGTSVGDMYVALFNDINYNTVFGTLNFTTGKVVIVNSYSYKWGKPGASISSMAYDKKYETLYGMEFTYDENDDYNPITILYNINPVNGEVGDEVMRIPGEHAAIASDGNGDLYIIKIATVDFQRVPSLWKINTESMTLGSEAVVANADKTCNYSYKNSCVLSPDGTKLYYIAGTEVNVFDLTAKTFSKVGEIGSEFGGATTTISSVDGVESEAPASTSSRKLIRKTWYGDSMGTQPDTQDMTQELYFYNLDGKLERSSKFGRTYNANGTAGAYDLIRYTKNSFDSKGNITNETRMQYGPYDFGDMAFKNSGETTYEYNADGKLVKNDDGSVIVEYVYDETGLLLKEIRTNAYNGNWSQTLEYMDWIDLDKPTVFQSTGAWDSYNYIGIIEYNENGEKISETHYKVTEDPDFGTPMQTPFEREEWIYEGTQLVEYTRYYADGQGNLIPSMRTTYTPVDGNPNKVKVVDETYFDGKWSTQAGSLCIYEYADFTGMDEMVATELIVEPDETTAGKVTIAFSVPPFAFNSQNPLATIYCDGKPVKNVNLLDIYDFDSGYCITDDVEVRNGEHEYFIQPLVDTYDEMGEEVTWTGFNISPVVSVTMNANLPAVTDLKLTGARTETKTQNFTKITTQYATVSWQTPADFPADMFKSNDLIFKGFQIGDVVTEDANVTSLETEVSLDKTSSPEVTLFILTRYTLGNVQSEPLTITFEDFNNTATAINETTLADAEGNAFSFAGNIFSVSDNADITVFSAGGQLVDSVKDASSISLGTQKSGTYIVTVKRGDNIKAYKVTLK